MICFQFSIILFIIYTTIYIYNIDNDIKKIRLIINTDYNNINNIISNIYKLEDDIYKKLYIDGNYQYININKLTINDLNDIDNLNLLLNLKEITIYNVKDLIKNQRKIINSNIQIINIYNEYNLDINHLTFSFIFNNNNNVLPFLKKIKINIYDSILNNTNLDDIFYYINYDKNTNEQYLMEINYNISNIHNIPKINYYIHNCKICYNQDNVCNYNHIIIKNQINYNQEFSNLFI